MDIDRSQHSFTIKNSPIEFVVIGATGLRSGVLVRSQELQIDLIGFAVLSRGKSRSFSSSLSRLTRLLNPAAMFFPRIMNYVESQTHQSSKRYREKRESKYRFYWIGSSYDSKDICDTFNLYLADLLAGIESGDIEQIEWSLAPTLLKCIKAKNRAKRIGLMSLFIWMTYLLPLLLVIFARYLT